MKNSSFSRRFIHQTRAAESGSAVLMALMTVIVIALIAGNVLTSVSSRYNSAYRSAGWNEAMITAQSGIDVTLSEVFRSIPNVSIVPSQGVGVGFSQPSLGLVTGLRFSATGLLTNGTVLSFSPPPLVHAGEGGTTQQATVSLTVVPLSQILAGGLPSLLNSVTGLLNGNDFQLLKIVSTGTVTLAGGTLAGPSRLDNELWRPSLFMNKITGQATSKPTVSRQVQVLLRPVYPFESATVSNDTFQATDAGTVFDSFNSTQTASSTNGQYDSLKHLTNGSVQSNTSTMNLGGMVYGNIGTNGATITKTSNVTGAVNNSSYLTLPSINPPAWIGDPLAPAAITGGTTLTAGTSVLPAQYNFTGISGNLHITRGLLGLGTNVQIYVNGDVTGGIEIDNGITAQVYVSGSINTSASKIKNDSLHAVNLQIYGVPNATGTTQQISLAADANLIAAIYAPSHNIIITGNGDISGSIVSNRFQTSGAVRVHYDESLAANVGPLLRYQIASWQEITN